MEYFEGSEDNDEWRGLKTPSCRRRMNNRENWKRNCSNHCDKTMKIVVAAAVVAVVVVVVAIA